MVTGGGSQRESGCLLISPGRQCMRLLVDGHPHAVVHASRDSPVAKILCCALHQQRQRGDHLFTILIITMRPEHEPARPRRCHASTKGTCLPPQERSGRHPHQHDPDRRRLRRRANRDKQKPQQQTHAQGHRRESTRRPCPEPFMLRRHRRINDEPGRSYPVTRNSVIYGAPAHGSWQPRAAGLWRPAGCGTYKRHALMLTRSRGHRESAIRSSCSKPADRRGFLTHSQHQSPSTAPPEAAGATTCFHPLTVASRSNAAPGAA